ncbi:MAG TPA: hypothetical protein VMU25_04490 [Candidatus Paceibacterota bacterium]|nr:hypothetical protein [Candidatus Paceibacterota bacterium]
MLDYLLENGIKSIVFWGIGLCAFALLYAVHVTPGSDQFPSIPTDKWQAVFLSNDQVYFGKLADVNGQYVALTDVYYLRTASDLEGSGSLNLIKLGGELHGPEDQMFIPKASILFWENMKDSSRVVQSIQSSKQ